MAILAVHYRRKEEPNNEVQGHWKEFTDIIAARTWLKWRTSKTAASPKGWIIFENIESVEVVLQSKKYQPPSLVKALEAWKHFKGIK